MGRDGGKGGVRARIAAAAARIMAEDGVDDFALAKRKAARQLGTPDGRFLPGNEEVEAELRAYRALYGAAEHAENVADLRRAALNAMRVLSEFKPYLVGAVLKGIASPHAAVELQLFPENPKAIELFLLERNIAYTAHPVRRFAGDRSHAATALSLDWEGIPFRMTVFDPRDERLVLKSSLAGRPYERAGIREVAALILEDGDSAQA
jgi:hypothetical protein